MTHLVSATCVGCADASVFCVPAAQQHARCSECARKIVGVPEVAVVGKPGPVVPRWTVDEALALGAPALSLLGADRVEQLSVFPAPEVTSGVGEWPADVEVPRGVRDLERHAVACGWAVKLQYSRGYGSHRGTGRPTALSHWIGVRMQCRASACGTVGYAVYCRPVSGRASWSLHNARHVGGPLDSVTAVREWLNGHGHEVG